MKISKVLSAPGFGGFFNDDQAAIINGAVRDGEFYKGQTETIGFSSIRVPAESLSVGLVLEDGYVAWGDMMSVQYAAASGRDPLFRSEAAMAFLQENMVESLLGQDVCSFKDNTSRLAAFRFNGKPLHVGMLYGLSQALLDAAAHVGRCTMAEQICTEYGLSLVQKPVPIYSQSGDLRKSNVDKMIMKRVDVLPHGLINNLEKFGRQGETFLEYVEWIVNRISKIASSDYSPVLYFDVYGMPGLAFDNDLEQVAEFLGKAARAAASFKLRIESPVGMDTAKAQIEGFATIRRQLKKIGANVEIAVDEWCNTLADIDGFIKAEATDLIQIKMPDLGGIEKSIEAVRRCHSAGVGAYLGGSCTETDISARASIHVGVATQVNMFLAKPGMGVDEAVMIVCNEQARLLAQLEGN